MMANCEERFPAGDGEERAVGTHRQDSESIWCPGGGQGICKLGACKAH